MSAEGLFLFVILAIVFAKLLQVQELIIHQGPYLLDNFLDEMLGFMNDPLMDVRKFVLGFIEQARCAQPVL
jgi:hypothetical protein